MNRFLLSSFFCAVAFTLWAQQGRLNGQVTDARTGEPLIGATVRLEGTELGTVTDLNGAYEIRQIPPKSYNITASYIGYATLTQFNIVIRSEGNFDVNFALQENVSELEQVVVVSNPFTKLEETPLSIQKLNQEEVAAYPGGNNDIAKVIQSLPGVSGSVGGFRNDVIIRGGAPNENVYYLDGIEIPNINHFATQGSAGGPVGLLNVSFFEGVTLTASSFGAQYDNVLSGVLQFDQRNGNARQFQGNVRVGASESALTVEGPLFKKEAETSNTTYIASVRRSYLQLLFGLIGLPFLPDYWDYQYKVNHRLDEYNELMITGIGSIDDLAINELDEYTPEQRAIQEQIPVIRQRTNTMGLVWKRRLKNGSGFMQTALSTNTLMNQFSNYEDNINRTGLYFQNDSREQETKLRYAYTRFTGAWTTTYGATVQYADYTNDTRNLVNDFNYRTSLGLVKYGLFAQSSARLAKDQVGVALGLRADANSFLDEGHAIFRTLSPRAALSYRLTPNSRWTVNASLGRYYKLPPYTLLGFQDATGAYANQQARYIRSDHAVLGMEYLVKPTARITAEGFYKWYDHYPVSITDSVSLANKGGGFEVLGNEPVSSVGQGRTYGVELLYQQKFNGRYYAIVAYTIYRSQFTGFDERFVSSTWDNGQLLSLTGGYKFKKNWEVSSRYRFLGRTPYAPIDQQATLANYPAVIRDYSQLGTVELNPFSQLDLRVDKKWNFRRFSMDVYLDIQNVLAQAQPSEPRFGLDRDETGAVVSPERLVLVPGEEQGSVIPSIGLVFNW